METNNSHRNDGQGRNEKTSNQNQLSVENASIGESAPSQNQDAIDAQRGDNDDFLSSGLEVESV